jgi:arylsulfatase A-like enzyme
MDHGYYLNEEQVRIPWIMAGPEIATTRISGLIETVDLFPTILTLLGPWSPPTGLPGRDLSPALKGQPLTFASWVHSSGRAVDYRKEGKRIPLDGERRLHSVRNSRWKLINYPGLDREYFSLFDLENDPGERIDLFDADRREVRELYAEMNRWNPNRVERTPKTSVAPEVEDRLRSLGYLGD